MGFHTSIHCHVIVIYYLRHPSALLIFGAGITAKNTATWVFWVSESHLAWPILAHEAKHERNMAHGIQEVGNGPQEKLLIVLPDVYGHRSVCLMCFRHELKWEYGKPFPRSTHGKTVELRSPRSQIPCWIPMIPMIPGKQERHKSNFCCLNPFVYCSYCKTWPI